MANKDTFKPLNDMLRKKASMDKFTLALEGTHMDVEGYLAIVCGHLKQEKMWKNLFRANITINLIAAAVYNCAKLGLTPGDDCVLLSFSGDNPNVVIQETAEGLRKMASSVPGFSFGNCFPIHRLDEWDEAVISSNEFGDTLKPEWTRTKLERIFKTPEDVIAVMGTIVENGRSSFYLIDNRDLRASQNSSKSSTPLYATDVRAWSRVVWIRMLCRTKGLVARAYAAARVDYIAVKNIKAQELADALEPLEGSVADPNKLLARDPTTITNDPNAQEPTTLDDDESDKNEGDGSGNESDGDGDGPRPSSWHLKPTANQE